WSREHELSAAGLPLTFIHRSGRTRSSNCIRFNLALYLFRRRQRMRLFYCWVDYQFHFTCFDAEPVGAFFLDRAVSVNQKAENRWISSLYFIRNGEARTRRVDKLSRKLFQPQFRPVC